jgi:hypothetical protein
MEEARTSRSLSWIMRFVYISARGVAYIVIDDDDYVEGGDSGGKRMPRHGGIDGLDSREC